MHDMMHEMMYELSHHIMHEMMREMMHVIMHELMHEMMHEIIKSFISGRIPISFRVRVYISLSWRLRRVRLFNTIIIIIVAAMCRERPTDPITKTYRQNRF